MFNKTVSHRSIYILITLAAGIATVILTGCLNPFAPGLGDISADLDVFLTAQKTPEDVLLNFQYAYTLKDSLVYRDLLTDDFIFVWRDHENDAFASWGKEDDIRTTAGLFNAFTVINLVWNSTNYVSYPTDSTTAEISKGFVLTLDSEFRISGEALFAFRKDKQTSIWKITRWVDKSVI